MSGRWASSNRRATLPSNWATIRLETKRLALGLCQARQHEPDCDGIGNECDHIGNPNDHSQANLQWLSTPCHKAKTQADLKARGRRRPRTEPHPGRLT